MTKSSTPPLLLVGHSGDLADLRYRSGFTPVDPVLFLDAGRIQHLVVPLLEVGRARHEAPQTRVRTPADLGVPAERRRSLSAWAEALLKATGFRKIRVPAFFPALVLQRLREAGVIVEIVEGPVYPARVVKDEGEITLMRGVQRAAVAAVRAAIEEIRLARPDRRGYLIRHGRRLTSEQVKTVIEIELMHHRCQARDTIVAGGRQATDPHERGSGPLRAGQAIVLDIFPHHKGHGYWGDITRTVVRGPVSPALGQLYQTVLRAQQLALRLVKPGARADRIHQAVQTFFTGAGYVTGLRQGLPVGFFHGTGHGVGLEIHEAPSISTVPVRLRPGHVVTVEPGLYYPELGGVRIEDTVVVTHAGARVLAPCEKVFQL